MRISKKSILFATLGALALLFATSCKKDKVVTSFDLNITLDESSFEQGVPSPAKERSENRANAVKMDFFIYFAEACDQLGTAAPPLLITGFSLTSKSSEVLLLSLYILRPFSALSFTLRIIDFPTPVPPLQ